MCTDICTYNHAYRYMYIQSCVQIYVHTIMCTVQTSIYLKQNVENLVFCLHSVSDRFRRKAPINACLCWLFPLHFIQCQLELNACTCPWLYGDGMIYKVYMSLDSYDLRLVIKVIKFKGIWASQSSLSFVQDSAIGDEPDFKPLNV